MNSADLFAAFASRLVPLLYENFSLPVKRPKQVLVDELENESELWELKRKESTVSGMVDIFEITGHMMPEMREGAAHKQSVIATQIYEKNQRLQHIGAVLDGTVAFLLSEGFVRSDDKRTYQLTLKGFVHLNKRFEQTGIQDGSRYIDRLVDLLRPEKFSGAVASGTLASLISKIFGG